MINGAVYKLAYYLRSLFVFEEIAGHPYKGEKTMENYLLLFSMLQANNDEFVMTFVELIDAFDEDMNIFGEFEAVLDALEGELAGEGIGSWEKPRGGYFISFDTLPGCAKRVVKLCEEAGVVMTGAGATYPYGKDPEDKNIRIAPTLPSPAELKQACEVFVASVKLASIEKLLAD